MWTTLISEETLKEISTFQTVTFSGRHRKWKYPLTEQVPSCYDYNTAQSLLEFNHRVTQHNRQVYNDIPHPVRLNPPNFDIVIPLNIIELGREVNVAWFFYSCELNIIVISFTATYNEILWGFDFDYFQVVPTTIYNYIDGMMMHGGFWKLYSRIQDNLLDLVNQYYKKCTQIITTGWSLGGATSTICALDLFKRRLNNGRKIRRLVHYSFASPRVVNTLGEEYYNSLHIRSHRIVNGSDIVPVVPLPIMPKTLNPLTTEDFTHVEGLQYFEMNLGTYYRNHVDAYLIYFKIPIIKDNK